MKIAAVIPARYNSSRFRGKPLVKIAGVPMIERVYRQVEKSGRFTDIIVATDDNRIAQTVRRFGGKFEMTSPHHRSGTDRLWEVIKDSDYDGAVNIQGDEPLISEELIRRLYDRLEAGEDEVVSAAFFNTSIEDYLSENVVKAVFDKNGRALYFSRRPIPFLGKDDTPFAGFYQHIGIYGYLRSPLAAFIDFPQAALEKAERLEQLRFLENGIPIAIIESPQGSYGVDTPQDKNRIEDMIRKKEKG